MSKSLMRKLKIGCIDDIIKTRTEQHMTGVSQALLEMILDLVAENWVMKPSPLSEMHNTLTVDSQEFIVEEMIRDAMIHTWILAIIYYYLWPYN